MVAYHMPGIHGTVSLERDFLKRGNPAGWANEFTVMLRIVQLEALTDLCRVNGTTEKLFHAMRYGFLHHFQIAIPMSE